MVVRRAGKQKHLKTMEITLFKKRLPDDVCRLISKFLQPTHPTATMMKEVAFHRTRGTMWRRGTYHCDRFMFLQVTGPTLLYVRPVPTTDPWRYKGLWTIAFRGGEYRRWRAMHFKYDAITGDKTQGIRDFSNGPDDTSVHLEWEIRGAYL